MNRILLGSLLGVAFGIADILMTVYGDHPEMTREMLLQAFSSRFAIGLLATTASRRFHPVPAGAVVGLLISLPDAFGLKSYAGILGTGVIFGAIAGWASWKWASS